MTIVTSMRQIVTSINRVSTAIQRYFTQLDPVANAYYELASPITLTGDFDIGIKLLTTDDTNQVILGDSHTDNLYMNMGSGSITLWLNGQHRAFNAVSKNLTDGKQHDILFQMRANTLECIIDSESLGTLNVTNPVITSANLRIGASNSVLIYFDGILSDLIITDKSGVEDVTTTFALDSGKGVSVEYSKENTFGSELWVLVEQTLLTGTQTSVLNLGGQVAVRIIKPLDIEVTENGSWKGLGLSEVVITTQYATFRNNSGGTIVFSPIICEIQGNALTRILVADEDIELFEKSGNQWNNISPLPQELPATIEIATQA